MASTSSLPPPPPLSPAVTPSPALFSHSISANSNYIIWYNEVQLVIKGHGLLDFLVAPITPSRFDTVADHGAGIVLQEYLNWENQILNYRSSSSCWMQHFMAALGETPCAFLLYCSHEEKAALYGSAQCLSGKLQDH